LFLVSLLNFFPLLLFLKLSIFQLLRCDSCRSILILEAIAKSFPLLFAIFFKSKMSNNSMKKLKCNNFLESNIGKMVINNLFGASIIFSLSIQPYFTGCSKKVMVTYIWLRFYPCYKPDNYYFNNQ
jgi:hypothetical protein